MRTKPTGVLVIAMFFFLSGGMSLAATIWLLMASVDTSRIPFVGGEAAKYILLVALMTGAVGTGYLATGWGLWELKRWAQAAAITVASIALLLDVAILILLSLGGSQVPIQLYLLVGLYAAVSLAIIVYLLMPATGLFFGSADMGSVETSCPRCLRPGILPGMSACPFCQLPLFGISNEPVLARASLAARPLSFSRTDPDGPALAVATTRVSSPTAPVLGWLIVKAGSDAGKRIDLRDDVEIGRDANCQLKLQDDYVSRQHARVKLEGGQFFIYDVGSRSGTFVNGRQVQRLMLYDGAEVRLGNTLLEFKKTRSN